ncbi:hypothetical protein MUP32_04675 [Candidatus Microgenomates bacterium]|nr:hypothetical protein [Candidatus Microgenomates bacterium]
MQKKMELAELKQVNIEFQKGFKNYLLKTGYNPDKLSDAQAEKIIRKIYPSR